MQCMMYAMQLPLVLQPYSQSFESRHERNGFLTMRKERRRSALQLPKEVRVSHNIPTNVALVSFSFVQQSGDICETFVRGSHDIHTNVT